MGNRFLERSEEIEIMDDLEGGGPVMDQTLRELEVINKLLGGNHVTIDGLNQLVGQSPKPTHLKIVDLGCGGGDMLKHISRWARKKNIAVELVGVDANPHVVAYAEKNTHGYEEISFKAVNIFSNAFKQIDGDIFISTLFTHHFTNSQLVTLFSQLKNQAHIGFVINDIHRHWFAYYSIKWLTRLFSKSPMVRNDAAVSVSRSFLKKDLTEILNACPCAGYSLHWRWAFRWQVIVRF